MWCAQRAHAGQVRDMVVDFCAKHSIPYHCTSLTQGTVEVLQHLRTVTRQLLEDFPAM
jgi:hypothetical protein